MFRYSLRPCKLTSLLALCFLSMLPSFVVAQTAKPSTSKKSSSKATPKNVKNGAIAAMDEESLTLKAANGTATPYALTEKTVFRKNRAECEASEFKVGDAVVIKLRKIRGQEEYAIQEVNDKLSWDWISDLRKKTVQATITEIAEDSVSVKVGQEAVPALYTTSDKTRWSKGGKDATSEAFKVGDKVTIVPRSLPSGNIMASIVADSEANASLTKERYARSVSGTLQVIDAPTKKMTVLTPLKDTRTFAYTEQTEVRIGYKKVPLPSLRVGQKVKVSLKKEEDTEETAYRITIEGKAPKTGKKTVTGKSDPEKVGVMPRLVKPKVP